MDPAANEEMGTMAGTVERKADEAAEVAAVIADIAFRNLNIDTLESRHADRLDFHEVAVWEIKAALEEAFNAGRASR